jgi:hypothetical protein
LPENSLPTPGDDESDDLSAFDDFVNKHLNFEGKSQAKPADDSASLFDDVPNLEEDDDAPAGTFGRPQSFSGPLRSPFGSGGPLPPLRPPGSQNPNPNERANPFSPSPNANMPPRMPIPAPDDKRWMPGYYSVRGDLEIVVLQPFLATRVMVIPDANRRLNKKCRYIANVAPGWSFIEVQTGRMMRGFVRNGDVRFMPGVASRQVMFPLLGKYRLRLDWLDLVIMIAVLLVLLAMATDIDDELFYLARGDVRELQAQVATQQAQIDALTAELEATPRPRASGDR